MKLEICVDSVDSALIAQEAGADRIELCSCLDVGGLTPSLGAITSAKNLLDIPIHVLIRPRMGDFCYSDLEFQQMLRDLRLAKDTKTEAVVFGILTPEGNVDIYRTALLVEAARPLGVTFHRAFDFCVDPFQALEDLISLGVDRILTSGQKNTALEGAPLIKELIEKAENKIIIMPGSGINSQNLPALIQQSGAKEFHLSASRFLPSPMLSKNQTLDPKGFGNAELSLRQADGDEIRKIKKLLS